MGRTWYDDWLIRRESGRAWGWKSLRVEGDGVSEGLDGLNIWDFLALFFCELASSVSTVSSVSTASSKKSFLSWWFNIRFH